MRFRILPLVMLVAFASVVVKVFDIALDSGQGAVVFEKIQAFAEDKKAAPAEGASAEGEGGDAPAEGGASPEGGGEGGEGAPKHAGDVEKPKAELGGNDENAEWSPGPHKGPKVIQPSEVSQMEKSILENLAKRREQLEKWSASISMKENILNATEKKINRKMDELKQLQEQVTELLKQYEEKEDLKILRLVKIYESMKPKDAARIFDDLEMPVLLQVIDKMKEAKAAPILANMDVNKANEITTQLAKQRKLSASN